MYYIIIAIVNKIHFRDSCQRPHQAPRAPAKIFVGGGANPKMAPIRIKKVPHIRKK